MSHAELTELKEELEILKRLLERTWAAHQRQLLHRRVWQLFRLLEGELFCEQ